MVSLKKFRLVAVLLVFCLVFELPGTAFAGRSYKGNYVDIAPLFKKPKQSQLWISAGVMAASCVLPAAFKGVADKSWSTFGDSFLNSGIDLGMGALKSAVAQAAVRTSVNSWGFNADAAQVFGYGVSGVISGWATGLNDNTAYLSKHGAIGDSHWWNNRPAWLRGAVVGGLKGAAIGGATLLAYNSFKDSRFFKNDRFFANQVASLTGTAIGHLGSSFILGDIMHIKTTADIKMNEKNEIKWKGKTYIIKEEDSRVRTYENGKKYFRISSDDYGKEEFFGSPSKATSLRLAFFDPSFVNSMVSQSVALGLEYAAYKGKLGKDLQNNFYYTRALGSAIGGIAGAGAIKDSLWSGLGNGILSGGISNCLNAMGGKFNADGKNKWGMNETQMAGVTWAGSYLARGIFAKDGWKDGLLDLSYNTTSYGGTSPYFTKGAGGYTEAKYMENLAQYAGYANFKSDTDYVRTIAGQGSKVPFKKFIQGGGLSNILVTYDSQMVKYVTSTLHYAAVDNFSAAITGMPGTIKSLFKGKEEYDYKKEIAKNGIGKIPKPSQKIEHNITEAENNAEMVGLLADKILATAAPAPKAGVTDSKQAVSNMQENMAILAVNPLALVSTSETVKVEGIRNESDRIITPFIAEGDKESWVDNNLPNIGKKLWRIPQILTLGILPTLMTDENRIAMQLKKGKQTDNWIDTDYFTPGTFSGRFYTKQPNVTYFQQYKTVQKAPILPVVVQQKSSVDIKGEILNDGINIINDALNYPEMAPIVDTRLPYGTPKVPEGTSVEPFVKIDKKGGSEGKKDIKVRNKALIKEGENLYAFFGGNEDLVVKTLGPCPYKKGWKATLTDGIEGKGIETARNKYKGSKVEIPSVIKIIENESADPSLPYQLTPNPKVGPLSSLVSQVEHVPGTNYPMVEVDGRKFTIRDKNGKRQVAAIDKEGKIGEFGDIMRDGKGNWCFGPQNILISTETAAQIVGYSNNPKSNNSKWGDEVRTGKLDTASIFYKGVLYNPATNTEYEFKQFEEKAPSGSGTNLGVGCVTKPAAVAQPSSWAEVKKIDSKQQFKPLDTITDAEKQRNTEIFLQERYQAIMKEMGN